MTHVHEWHFGFRPDGKYNDLAGYTLGISAGVGFYCIHPECGFKNGPWLLLPEIERRLNATELLTAEDASLLAFDVEDLIAGYHNKNAMHCGAADEKLRAYAKALEADDETSR